VGSGCPAEDDAAHGRSSRGRGDGGAGCISGTSGLRQPVLRDKRGSDQAYSSGGVTPTLSGEADGGSGAAQAAVVGPLGFKPSERTGIKQGKGLRHFSMRMCEKVESKGTTTYNEVADELVAEMKGAVLEDGTTYDEKNIRWEGQTGLVIQRVTEARCVAHAACTHRAGAELCGVRTLSKP
jgi:hypothetical protein